MPHDEPSPDDPMLLVGTSVEAGPEADLEMAYAFAEEFVRMGYDEERLWRVFEKPFYAGAHRVLQILGEERIRDVIREVVGVWGRTHTGVTSAASHSSDRDATGAGSQRSQHQPLTGQSGFVRLRLPDTAQRKGGRA
jgi:hypothetical protein